MVRVVDHQLSLKHRNRSLGAGFLFLGTFQITYTAHKEDYHEKCETYGRRSDTGRIRASHGGIADVALWCTRERYVPILLRHMDIGAVH